MVKDGEDYHGLQTWNRLNSELAPLMITVSIITCTGITSHVVPRYQKSNKNVWMIQYKGYIREYNFFFFSTEIEALIIKNLGSLISQ